MVDVEEGVVEGQEVELPPVDDHHLVVIADEVVGGLRDLDPDLAEARGELAHVLGLGAAVGVADQRVDRDAAHGGGLELLLDLEPVEPVDDDLDALLGPPDSFKQRLDAVPGLDDDSDHWSPQSEHGSGGRGAGDSPAGA